MSRTLVIVSRIIWYYSIFYVVLKVITFFSETVRIPHLILALPFAVMALLGWRMEKRNSYSWIYAITGILFISVVRYYESEWIAELHRWLAG